MSRRGLLAMAVLLVWGATLGWHVKRLYLRPLSAVLAEAARTIPPGSSYYTVYRGDARIGWASTEVDTLPGASGFTVLDRLILEEPLLPGQPPLRLSVNARLGPTLSLQTFVVEAEGIPGIRGLAGEVHGDTALALQAGDSGAPDRWQVPLTEPVLLASTWPLRLAAEDQLAPGARVSVPVFDPLGSSSVTGVFTVLEADTKSYPDSVDAVDGEWILAREDTVQAWRIEHEIGGVTLRSWVDEDGRLLSAEMPGGIRLERTAFELAFFGDRPPETAQVESEKVSSE